jgi:hypothetical protein
VISHSTRDGSDSTTGSSGSDTARELRFEQTRQARHNWGSDVSESSTVAGDDLPTIGAGGRRQGLSVTPDDGGQRTREFVTAVLRGGPAAGKQVEVPRIAGTFPLFIGVDGGNYVRDKGTSDHPVYNWWPAGASAPAGDPNARTDSR